MVPRKRVPMDESSSEDEISVDRMIETKDELTKIRRDRMAKRDQLEESLSKQLANLRQRIEQTIKAHTKHLGDINKQQVDRLERAVDAQIRIYHMIEEKLVGFQREIGSLVAVLDRGYEYRLNKAKSLVTPVSQQEPTQSEARPVKRAKIGSPSS